MARTGRSPSSRLPGFVLASILLALTPGHAAAAVVDGDASWDTGYRGPGDTQSRSFDFTAGKGERNRVLVRRRGPWVLFADSGAKRIVAKGFGCSAAGPRTARCRISDSEDSVNHATNVEVRTHAGNDRVVIAESVGLFATVFGGTGEDRILVAPPASIFAGPGNDQVRVYDYETDVDCGTGRDRYRSGDTFNDPRSCELRRQL